MKKYIYTGVFFDYAELQKLIDKITQTRLSRMIENPHVTFAFKPSRVNPEIFGKKAEYVIIGYACDGYNQGIQVELRCTQSAELMNEHRLIQNPHITISVGENGKPVNTGKMTFKPLYAINSELEDQLHIIGTYGGFVGGNVNPVDYSGKV